MENKIENKPKNYKFLALSFQKGKTK